MTDLDVPALAAELAALIGAKATPALLTADEAAELLSVPKTWLMAEARAERVPHVKLGKYTRFDSTELFAWLDQRSVGPRRRGQRTA